MMKSIAPKSDVLRQSHVEKFLPLTYDVSTARTRKSISRSLRRRLFRALMYSYVRVLETLLTFTSHVLVCFTEFPSQ